MSRLLALIGLAWMLGCWAGFVYCVVLEEYGLAFGLAFASLAVPILIDPVLAKEDA
jgi:hypothetical protein